MKKCACNFFFFLQTIWKSPFTQAFEMQSKEDIKTHVYSKVYCYYLRSFGNTMYPFKSSATTSLFPVDNRTGKFNVFG